MKKFGFQLNVVVCAETEDEAREVFCDDPGSWQIDEDDLLCTSVEDLDFITVHNEEGPQHTATKQEPSGTAEFNRVLYKLRELLMDVPLEDRVKPISEVSRMLEECW